MANKEAIKKFVLHDRHGQEIAFSSFAVVGEVEVNLGDGIGEPTAESTYEGGKLTINIDNIKGDGIASIEQTPSTEDEGINIVTITCESGASYQLQILNGSKGERGNGIESITEDLSDQDGGINTYTITDDDGHTHTFHTRNGRAGTDFQLIEDISGLKIAHGLGQDETKVMSQKGVTDAVSSYTTVKMTDFDLEKGYVDSSLETQGTSSSSRHIIIPVENLASVITVAGKPSTPIPAVIYLDSDNIGTANIVGAQYAEGDELSPNIAVFNGVLNIPANATHALINLIGGFPTQFDNAEITTRENIKDIALSNVEKLKRLGYTYLGMATKNTVPSNVNKTFYLAKEEGTYEYFGGIQVKKGLSILKYYDSTWHQDELFSVNDVLLPNDDNPISSKAVFDALNESEFIGISNVGLEANAYKIENDTLTLWEQSNFLHKVIPIDKLTSLVTIASGSQGSALIPAIIYLSGEEPIESNRISEQYGTQDTSYGGSIKKFVSILDIPANATHAIIQSYKRYSDDCGVTYSTSIKDEISRFKSLIVVDANGNGDYSSLQEAINNVGDSASNPKTILVMPGVYVMPTNYSRNNAQNRYLSIIGTDKNNCIVRNDVGFYVTGSNYTDNSPLRLAGNVYVANLTIISTDSNYPQDGATDRHKSYCIHLDMDAPEGAVCEINNCVLVNDHFACIGYGLRTNYTIKIVNCELTSTFHESNKATVNTGNSTDYYSTLWGHDGTDTSTTEITQHIVVKDCVITNTNDINGLSYYNARNGLADMTLINNIVDVQSGGSGFIKANTATLTRKCFGNNIQSMNYQ